MPRDLTDLMESATSFAPPEPHGAAEVTSMAASHLRRRRAGLVGAVTLLVVVAGGLGYGAARGHDTTPEPASQYKYGRTVTGADSVPAASLPGYQAEPWKIPGIQHLSSGTDPFPTYRSVDADGRLIVQRYPGDNPDGLLQVQLYDHPGAAPSPLQVPPTPGSNAGRTIGWLPSFTGDGRLLWAPDRTIADGNEEAFHLTDLSGGNDVRVLSGFTIGKTSFGGTPQPGVSTLGVSTSSSGWGLFGDQYWFLTYDHNLPGQQGSASALYTASFDAKLTKIAGDVAVMAAKDGRVAWVTTQGEVMTETADDPSPHRVPVPLSAGCRVTPTLDLEANLGTFAVDRSVIAVTEQCGRGDDPPNELLAFDPSGRMLVHLAGAAAFAMSLTPDAVLAESTGAKASDFDVLRYDFVTGRLADLGTVAKNRPPAQGAGDYVLWYDTHGGHVARIPQ